MFLVPTGETGERPKKTHKQCFGHRPVLGHSCLAFFLSLMFLEHVLGVSETGSAKTGSAIDVRIDDAGSILKFRIGFFLFDSLQ